MEGPGKRRIREIFLFSSNPAAFWRRSMPEMPECRMLPTDLQSDTMVEGSGSAAGDGSGGPGQACSSEAGATATGAVSAGGAGDSTGAALQGGEAWQLVPTAGGEGLRWWAAGRARCRLRARP